MNSHRSLDRWADLCDDCSRRSQTKNVSNATECDSTEDFIFNQSIDMIRFTYCYLIKTASTHPFGIMVLLFIYFIFHWNILQCLFSKMQNDFFYLNPWLFISLMEIIITLAGMKWMKILMFIKKHLCSQQNKFSQIFAT